MSQVSSSQNRLKQISDSDLTEALREKAIGYSKDFKTSWTQLGQILYAIYEDKLFHAWGYEKFEDYSKKELGFNKQVTMKMLKSYLFIEDDEPNYLKKDFTTREVTKIPSLEEVNVLRLAKGKKELTNGDYAKLKAAVFEKGKDASGARKDLTAMMKERKPVDPEQEREDRHSSSINQLIASLKSFKKDMNALKIVPQDIVEEAEHLMEKLKEQVS